MWPIIGIGWVTNLLQRGAASMERINRLLRVAPEIKEEKEHKKPTKWKIEFRDLSFSYNGREILKGINFSIQEGESLGIVGEIGSGKSTLVSLIPRLFEPNKGEIRIDGIPIKEIAFSMLRRNIGFVPQDTFLFSDTIKNNIAFGQPEASESEIYRVARLAEIHEEIMSFPSKYEEIVGERGITLSGGQRQRIAIARTILTNPKVLILDNALSSVDIEKEINIIQNLKKEFKGRTLIIISHRLRSIIGLDKIIVLDYGKIVEEGTHNELMENKGLYFNLFKTQEVEERWK
jgi:ATP-binding cassette subfamily B protein